MDLQSIKHETKHEIRYKMRHTSHQITKKKKKMQNLIGKFANLHAAVKTKTKNTCRSTNVENNCKTCMQLKQFQKHQTKV